MESPGFDNMLRKGTSKAGLVLAALMLFVGVCSIARGWAGMYGLGQIYGTQAKLFGIVCLIFALSLIYAFFRAR